MSGWLDRFLGTEDGEDITLLWRRRAVLLIAVAYSVVSIVVTAITSLPTGFTWLSLVCPATVAVYAISVVMLNRGSSIEAAAVVLMISSTLSTTTFVWVSNGVLGSGAILFIGGPLAGALLMGMRGAIFAAVLCSAIILLAFFFHPDAAVTLRTTVRVSILLMSISAFTLFSVAMNRMTDAMFLDLTVARDEARRASDAKSAFLANMSHEIRTPLNGVIALADNLSKDDLSDESLRKAEVIRGSGELLLRIINDVLDVSKMEAGAMEIEQRPFDLVAMARQIESLYRPRANERGLLFTVGVDETLNSWRTGDEHRLSQVVGNLVSNAIKFTRQGSVSVSIQGDAKSIQVSVADTGYGMEPQQTEKIFSPFAQADSSTTRQFGGTGLGLSIVLGLTQKMGGTVDLETELGRGTTFKVDLPLTEATIAGGRNESSTLETEEVPDLTGMKILVVDDSQVNLMVLSTLLKPTAASVVQATDGFQSLECAESQAFDVILMDISMPGMDGVEATTTIRATSALNATTPIIATTAHALDHEVKALLGKGFNDHIAKPISSARLYEVITGHIDPSSLTSDEATSAAS